MPRPTMRCPGSCCAALLALALAAASPIGHANPPQSASRHYALDPVHTRVMFAMSHAGFSQAHRHRVRQHRHAGVRPRRLGQRAARGQRAACSGSTWATRNGTRPRSPATCWTASTIRSRLSFRPGSNPSTPQHATVFGTLTLHGVAQEVKLDVTLNELKRYPLPPFRRTAGFLRDHHDQPQGFRHRCLAVGDRRQRRAAHRSRSARATRGADDAATQERPRPDDDDAEPDTDATRRRRQPRPRSRPRHEPEEHRRPLGRRQPVLPLADRAADPAAGHRRPDHGRTAEDAEIFLGLHRCTNRPASPCWRWCCCGSAGACMPARRSRCRARRPGRNASPR